MKVPFRYFLPCFFTAYSFSASGQDTVTKYNADSTVVIIQDARLDGMVKRQKNANLAKQTMPGYRIQIYFGSVRQKATDIKLDFTDKHNDVATYLTYQQPNFKVRVGDFRTRLEAQRFLKSMEGEYTTMFIVPDEVKLPSIK
jgi:hypothetical protein